MTIFTKLSYKFNKDVQNTALVNIIRMFTGSGTILLIPFFLSKQIQGYWYSFNSISAMSVLADLGFTSIIIQFAAHEYAFIKQTVNGKFEGEEEHVQRLLSFFNYVFRRGIAIILICFPVIFIVGVYILHSGHELALLDWIIPWVIFVFFSGLNFLFNLIGSFLEGCNYIYIIQRQRYVCAIINFLIIALCLCLGLGLYSLAFGMVFNTLFLGIQLWLNFKDFIRQAFNELAMKVRWNTEINQLLFKYALSFIGGFLIFQLFTPVAFKFYGTVFAGQVGISITLVMAIFQIANVWIYVSIPKLNMFVSIKKTKDLIQTFNNSLKLAILTFLIVVICVILLFLFLPERYTTRFLPLPMLISLLIAWFLQLIINSVAIFSRAHKVEKFVIPSLVMGIYTAVSTILITLYLPSEYFFAGFLSSYLFAFPWFYLIYYKHKQEILKSCNE